MPEKIYFRPTVDHYSHRQGSSSEVYIGRDVPRAGIFQPSIWENEFRLHNPNDLAERWEVLAKFTEGLLCRQDLIARIREGELSGKTLLCWCKKKGPSDPTLCHGDVLAIFSSLLAGYPETPELHARILKALPGLLRQGKADGLFG